MVRLVWCLALGVFVALGCAAHADEPDACDSLTPAIIGGPMPPTDSNLVLIRWLANANFEVDYDGKVYLFDAYFDRVSRNRPIGFSVPQINRADVILVSHAHFDHISDIGPVAKQTGAPVVGAPITIDMAEKLGVPQTQTITAKGGETLHFGDATVDVALAQHSTIQDGLIEAYHQLYKVETRADTPDEAAHTKQVVARGTFAPEVITQGTLVYGLILKNGFKIVVIGSAGPITDGDRALAEKLGPVDVAIVAYQPHAVAERQIPDTMALLHLYRPRLYIPAHQDQSFGTWLDLGLEPLFEVIRDEMPDTSFVAPLYRSPMCIATTGGERGRIVKMRY
jgi:L-ascorbate metabolism protein UlaG (beta-lactamase superfamily)